MPKITCRLTYHPSSPHMQQVYTGLVELHKRGIIEFFGSTRTQRFRDTRRAHLGMIVNDSLKLHYDTRDSWEISEESLRECHFYFKRSYSSSHLEYLGENRNKIQPLGLNYLVYPSNVDRFAQVYLGINKRRKLIEFLRSLNPRRFVPRVNIMESLPDYDATPKVLFMAGTWDPYDDPGRTKDKIEERIHMNEVRARCIKLLKDELGSNFYGGFIHSKFALKNYKDFLMPDNTLSSKGNYINLLRSYPICVATTGLHGSIGWKLAEYVCFSKSIVSERLNYEVPGGFAAGINYLAFNSPEDCVAKAMRLVSDRKLRNYIMTNNSKYYHSYLRPDSLILNSILTALSANTADP